MKKFVVLAGSALALSLTASAQAAPSGWYVGIAAGLNSLDDTENHVSVGGGFSASGEKVSFDNGYAVLVTTGYAWSHIRLELEGGYRSNDGSVDLGIIHNIASADVTQWSGMVNVYYDMALVPQWTLSLGAGLGLDSVEMNAPWFINGSGTQSDSGVAEQVMVQLAYDVSDCMQVYADYRYVNGGDADFENQFGLVTETNRFEIENNSLTIGIRWDLEASK
ncbi:MAG: outer membrane beta-barrel protein [Micropepsaceae bacterium]